MGIEIDLMRNYPRAKRDPAARAQTKSEEDRALAREFGKDFFDGDRRCGYGGFTYNEKYWTPVIPDFQANFNLTPECHVLDVGCAKGFMLFDMQRLIPGITVAGLDISDYAITHALESMQPCLQVGDALNLPYEDNAFDVVISVTTIHNLDLDGCAQALQEVERVSRRGAFITLDAYRNEEEKQRMHDWNLTAKTVMHVDEWKAFFKKVGYTGDYYWFIP